MGRAAHMGQKRQSGPCWENLKGLFRRRRRGDGNIEMDTKK
jgi:hypothetical protein